MSEQLSLMLCWIIFCDFGIFDGCGQSGEVLSIRCPSHLTTEADPGGGFRMLTFPDPVVLSGTNVTFTRHPDLTYFPIGQTNLTFTASDSSGQEEICSFHVTVTARTTESASILATTSSSSTTASYTSRSLVTTFTMTNVPTTSTNRPTSISKEAAIRSSTSLDTVELTSSPDISSSLTTSTSDDIGTASPYLLISILLSGVVVVLCIFLTLSCCLIYKYQKRERNNNNGQERVTRNPYENENENWRELALYQVKEHEERNRSSTMDTDEEDTSQPQFISALIRIPSVKSTATLPRIRETGTYVVDFSET
ncbi:uncharacterized protein [Amphiura filiformis]|uniref:uncharacterized protein n=1 Tax=Amphiura filiformis TaxID=82378 RepID=UPI003B21AD39